MISRNSLSRTSISSSQHHIPQRNSVSVTPAPPPLPPSTPPVDPLTPSTILHCFGLTASLQRVPFKSIAEAIAYPEQLIWIDVASPSQFEVSEIAGLYDLDADTQKSCIWGSVRDKCDIYSHYTVVGSNVSENHYVTSLLFSDRLLTFHPWESSGICERVYQVLLSQPNEEEDENADGVVIPSSIEIVPIEEGETRESEVEERSINRRESDVYWTESSKAARRSPVWIMSKIIEDTVMQFEPKVESIVSEVETLSDLVFKLGVKDSNELLVRVGRASGKLCGYRMILKPKRKILARLLSNELSIHQQDILSGGMYNYFHNIIDRIVHMEQMLDGSLSHLTSIQSGYLGQISIDMAISSYRVTRSMQQLNIITAVMVPLTVIMGAFSMNVTVPGEVDYSGDLTWFFSILGFMGLFVILMVLYLRRLTAKTKTD